MKPRAIIVYGLILTGILLSVLSHYNWCSSEGCSQLHGVRIFSVSMNIWGMLFFLSLGILTPLARSNWISAVRTALLAGALGVEVTLLTVQCAVKDVCLLCLAVTGVVLALCGMEVADMAAEARSLKAATPGVSRYGWVAVRSCLVLAGLALGMVFSQPVKSELAVGGPARNTSTAAIPGSIPCIGKQCGYPVIRIYSDYFCPTCRQQEPVINAVIADVDDRARIVFCDLPTHGTISKKYIAYFIACLLGGNDDEQLLHARQSLFDLAGEKVQASSRLRACLTELGIRMKLDGPSVNECFSAIRDMAIKDGVRTTPTVVVENDSGEKRVFKGRFTRDDLLEALKG